ncbi:hypothetical protein LXA43DRAFT_546413 [Ganoderma leucocontextum]|nr:hypothetical protein LXA43DRAFT_546413 [Ganoderma leucocontextum]
MRSRQCLCCSWLTAEHTMIMTMQLTTSYLGVYTLARRPGFKHLCPLRNKPKTRGSNPTRPSHDLFLHATLDVHGPCPEESSEPLSSLEHPHIALHATETDLRHRSGRQVLFAFNARFTAASSVPSRVRIRVQKSYMANPLRSEAVHCARRFLPRGSSLSVRAVFFLPSAVPVLPKMLTIVFCNDRYKVGHEDCGHSPTYVVGATAFIWRHENGGGVCMSFVADGFRFVFRRFCHLGGSRIIIKFYRIKRPAMPAFIFRNGRQPVHFPLAVGEMASEEPHTLLAFSCAFQATPHRERP